MDFGWNKSIFGELNMDKWLDEYIKEVMDKQIVTNSIFKKKEVKKWLSAKEKLYINRPKDAIRM